MERAVQGESNTLLLLGGPGTGKSSIVNTALETLKRNHPEKGSFYTIHLDGQIQTDDKIALREIARQLALEMDIEMEKVQIPWKKTSYNRCHSQIP
jgi:origin recognition complex subunit 4